MVKRVIKTRTVTAKPPNPRGKVRNLYVHGYAGKTTADGKVEPFSVISGGPWGVLGGMDLSLYMRTSALTAGAALVCRVEGRTDAEGTITLRVIEEGTGKVLGSWLSQRDGIPVKKEDNCPQ